MQPGCAFHATGLVESARSGVRLTEVTGERWRLVLLGSAESVAALEGLVVEVDGQRLFRAVRVGDWRVREGAHGLPVWVGPIQQMGSQIGIQDRNSGQFFWLDEQAARVLAPSVGQLALVEGWVDGPHRVRVTHYLLLDAE
jgi:hypothetical protein